MKLTIAAIAKRADIPTPKTRIDILWKSPVEINIAVNKDVAVIITMQFDRILIQGAIGLSSMAG